MEKESLYGLRPSSDVESRGENKINIVLGVFTKLLKPHDCIQTNQNDLQTDVIAPHCK